MDTNILPSFIRPFFTLATIVAISLLVACGGGGGGGGGDTTPDAFTFTDVVDADLGVEVISAAVTINGINRPTAISISGGEYAIGTGAFTSAAGQINNGSTVVVRLTSSDMLTTETAATLAIGGVSDEFSVMTLADTSAPTATILFPTPVAFTERDLVTVRGSAVDDYSSITSVEVNGIAATSTDDYATWVVDDVPLAMGDNSLVVTTSDAEMNTDATAAIASIRRGIEGEGFPDNSFSNLFFPVGIDIDLPNQRLLVGSGQIIFAVNMLTGEREILSSAIDNIPDNQTPFQEIAIVRIDTSAQASRLLATDFGANALFAVDLTDGTRTIVSDNSTTTAAPFEGPFGFVIDGSRAIVADPTAQALIEVDLETGARNYVSNNIDVPPNMNNTFVAPYCITLNSTGDRAFVSDVSPSLSLSAVLDVALVDGNREIYSSNTIPNSEFPFIPLALTRDDARNRLVVTTEGNPILVVNTDPTPPKILGQRSLLSDNNTHPGFNQIGGINDIVIDSNGAIAYITSGVGEIMVLDLENGHRVILSRGGDD